MLTDYRRSAAIWRRGVNASFLTRNRLSNFRDRWHRKNLIELRAFHPGIQSVGASETGAEAADIRPVGASSGESEQLAAFETRCVLLRLE
jgi:hypothetical protein